MHGPSGLVIILAMFCSDRTCPNQTKPAAIASRTRIIWQERCFFLIFDDGSVVLTTTDRLSPSNSLLFSTLIPRHRSLYRILIIESMAIRAAIISDPNVDVSTVRCHFDIQTSGVLFISNNVPVTDQRVTLFLA
jgi:hypothetical protein